MKRRLLVAIILALGLFGSVSAAYYLDYCTEAACHPFTSTNSYVQQKAVNLAYNNNAAVGDLVYLVDTTGTQVCEDKTLEWTVNHIPTLNSTHLTLTGAYCTTRDQ